MKLGGLRVKRDESRVFEQVEVLDAEICFVTHVPLEKVLLGEDTLPILLVDALGRIPTRIVKIPTCLSAGKENFLVYVFRRVVVYRNGH